MITREAETSQPMKRARVHQSAEIQQGHPPSLPRLASQVQRRSGREHDQHRRKVTLAARNWLVVMERCRSHGKLFNLSEICVNNVSASKPFCLF
jgi:hypothetical protein